MVERKSDLMIRPLQEQKNQRHIQKDIEIIPICPVRVMLTFEESNQARKVQKELTILRKMLVILMSEGAAALHACSLRIIRPGLNRRNRISCQFMLVLTQYQLELAFPMAWHMF